MPKGVMKKPTKAKVLEMLQRIYWDASQVRSHNSGLRGDPEIEKALTAYKMNHPPGIDMSAYVVAKVALAEEGPS